MIDLRTLANTHREELLEKHQQMLAQGKPADEVLAKLADALTNKIIHNPTQALNHAAREGDESLLQAAKRLFKLNK